MWTGFTWLRIGPQEGSCKHLEFKKMLRICWVRNSFLRNQLQGINGQVQVKPVRELFWRKKQWPLNTSLQLTCSTQRCCFTNTSLLNPRKCLSCMQLHPTLPQRTAFADSAPNGNQTNYPRIMIFGISGRIPIITYWGRIFLHWIPVHCLCVYVVFSSFTRN
jgi:hypothetical protein